MSTTEERLLEWLYNNIASFIVYRESPINANRTAIYDDLIEQQRVAISAVETCRQLKKALFDKKNVTDKELVSLVLQLKSGRWMQETGGRTMKTPDEIKKGLYACGTDECHGQHTDCPYNDGHSEPCIMNVCGDALAYIEQLEAERTAKEILKPRSIIMPDGRDIKSIEYKIDIFAYKQKQKEESFVFRIMQDMSEQLKAEREGKNHE